MHRIKPYWNYDGFVKKCNKCQNVKSTYDVKSIKYSNSYRQRTVRETNGKFDRWQYGTKIVCKALLHVGTVCLVCT